MLRECKVYLPPQPVPYVEAWGWQKRLVEERLGGANLPAVLIVLEHPPVYTLGQGSSLEFLKFSLESPPVEIYRTERGGEVTYHTIGQVVGYPILNLRHYQTDLHWYLRQLEALLLAVLAEYGINGQRRAGMTGVWVGDRKIGQIGIKVKRWITMHGFALNVNMDMSGFSQIVPCGIKEYGCTQLRDYVPTVTVADVIPRVLGQFACLFDLQLQLRSIGELSYVARP